MRHIDIDGRYGSCRITLGFSMGQLDRYCDPGKAVIITDRTIKNLLGKFFCKYRVVEIGTGEKAKTLKTVHSVYEKFLDYELDRTSFVLAVGGGIVCDVAGYVASTYLRGLPFGFIPTTLLAQTDAAIGGKNGVNFKGYKNLIGTFNQPRFVLCDLELLKTLSARELKNGFAEIIKHALIGDAFMLSYLEKEWRRAYELEGTFMEQLLFDSLKVKACIVSQDETEKGERRKLNFGHTFGHALEKIYGLKHGEAISIGMVLAARISVAKGLIDRNDMLRIEKILAHFGLPVEVGIEKDLIMDAIRKDKKREGENINFVLLNGIGNAVVLPISIEELEEMVRDMC